MTPEQLTQARKVADQLKDRYGCAVPTSQAAALLRRQADHIDAQAAEIERLKATAARADTQAAVLRTVERWANHHARKPKTTAEEALGVIQHHPAIREITASYADGVVPDTPDPYAEIERLQHQADQVDRIDVRSIVDALSWMGVSTPEGGTEAAAAQIGRLVNYLSAAVLRHKMDHRSKSAEVVPAGG